MRFDTAIDEDELPELLKAFVKIAKWGTWEKHLSLLEREALRETGMQHFWQERYALELAFSSIWRRQQTRRRLRVGLMGPEELRFLSFAASVVRCHEGLTGGGRNRLTGMLRDATNQEYGLGPLAHEMHMAMHLMSQGYDVGFHDLEGGAGYDFQASKDGAVIEVECKFISGDIGRKIHLKRLYQFGERVSGRMLAHLRNLRTGLFVRLTIPGRLYGREEHQQALSELLGRAVVSGQGLVEAHGNRVLVEEFDVAEGWASASRVDRKRMEVWLATRFGLENKNVLVYVQPGRSAIVVVIESAVSDLVLDGMFAQLRKSSKGQFGGSVPAILCCHLADVSEEQLVGLGDEGRDVTGLEYMTGELIRRRPHLHSVTYTAQGSVGGRPVAIGGLLRRSIGETAPAYTIRNFEHPLARDGRLSVFPAGWG